jgi:protein tyrosine phosphatase (PTP) superfamily phosphohydrolase (DUF442 family)
MRIHRAAVCRLAVLTLSLWAGVALAAEPGKGSESERRWASAIEKPGLPNLHRVAAGVYRGAQPTAEGMKELEKMGVKTVIDFRFFHSDKDEIGNTKLTAVSIPMNAWSKPTEEQVVQFLRVVTDENRRPVFFHCQHGADRTGVMCAAYRVAVDGWTKDEAIREMTEGDFGFHAVWTHLPKVVREMDIEAVKKKAGLGQ